MFSFKQRTYEFFPRGHPRRSGVTLRKQGVGTYHEPFNTIRQQLVHTKDPTAKENKMRSGLQTSVEGLQRGLHW